MAKQDQMEEEFLSCYICFDVFKEPKTLTCLHRFCERCLHNYIIALAASATNRHRGFPCPVCREFIASPDPKRPPSDWAALLRTDFHLKNLIKFVEYKTERLKGNQLYKIEHPCQMHKDTDCDLYCVDCSKVVCHLCAGIAHRRCNQVITVMEAAEDRRATLRVAIHSVSTKLEEAIKYSNIREKCISELDRRKGTVEAEIKKWAQDIRQLVSREERSLLDHLQKKYDTHQMKISSEGLEFENSITKVKNHLKTASSKKEAASDYDLLMDNSVFETIKEFQETQIIDIKQYRSFLLNLSQVKIVFRKNETPAISLGDVFILNDNKPTEDTSNISTQTSSLGNRRETQSCVEDGGSNKNTPQSTPLSSTVPKLAGSSIIEMDRAKLSRSKGTYAKVVTSTRDRTYSVQQSVLVTNRTSEQPTSQTALVTNINSEQSTSQTALVTNIHSEKPTSQTALVTNINSEQSTSQTALVMNIHSEQSTSQTALATNRNSEQHTSQRLSGIDEKKALLLRSINSRFREDAQDPKLRDLIVLVPGNTIIVTDWANQSVKAFYTRRERDSRLVVGGKPWAITQLSDNLAAVSLPLSKQICIIKTVPFLTVQNSFMSAKNYSGLATLNSTMLVASGGTDPPAVDIINLYGEVLRSFTNDNRGVPMFKYPAYVSVTPSLLILVSDRKLGAVICMSHKGEIKFIFQPDGARHLKEPSGVTSDSSGRIFVVESRGLLLITPDGQFDRALLRPQDCVLFDPRGVALDSGGLVHLTSHDSEIKVFKTM